MRKFLFIWCLFSFVIADVCFAREVSVGEQRDNENRLDSIWRKGVIWNLGALNLSGKPFKDEEKVEFPRWVVWSWYIPFGKIFCFPNGISQAHVGKEQSRVFGRDVYC